MNLTTDLNSQHAKQRTDAQKSVIGGSCLLFSNCVSTYLYFGLTIPARTRNELVATVMEADWNTEHLFSSVLIHTERR